MRIVFAGGGTGGHLYPGLAIARALVRLEPRVTPFFVGAERGIERQVLPTTEFPHVLLDLHPLYRPRVWKNWRTARGAFTSWRRLGALVREERPKIVVGTGGYAAGVAMAYAITHRIPMVQQAGDVVPGITARFFSRWSREIYLNFPEASRYLRVRHPDALIDTGAPIEPPPNPRPDRAAARQRWGFPPQGGPVLLVHGASQGALAINRAMREWIERGIPEHLHIIWATGKGTYEQFRDLDRAAGGRVRVRDYLAPISDAYAATDFAVTRAGAMTTAELMAWTIPPILVPLPTAAADHQTTNATALAAAGAALMLRQMELTAASLDAKVRGLLDDQGALERLRAGARSRARPNAADEIAQRIVRLLGN
jgi:UDP-N-acetylglucosamine--N-acetylmuramyl-(pentapeptide) pyrophosphoryl-undecaprenol N-acetylglucosamine transferase